MSGHEKVNILLVDDQPAKLLSYEVILKELGENLIKATSGREALEHLLKTDVAVVLLDVCMPDLDGFQLAAMIREHPRFQNTAMIFISAIQVTDVDRLRGYEMGAVDYVPVPVIPEVLRAKVKVFAELYRKTRQLERLNAELEERVAARTAELEASTARLLQSEERRSLALAASNMGSWDWDRAKGDCLWDEGQHRIFGVDAHQFSVTAENVRALLHPDDWGRLQQVLTRVFQDGEACEAEFRVRRPNGEIRWCIGTAAPSVNGSGEVVRISGVTMDITDRKQAEERQTLLAREVDHPTHSRTQHRQLCRGRRRAHQGAVTRAYAAVGVSMARGRPCRAGRRRISAVPDGRSRAGIRKGTRCFAAALHSADAGARAA
jgi:PAS domain S-box-containing protein